MKGAPPLEIDVLLRLAGWRPTRCNCDKCEGMWFFGNNSDATLWYEIGLGE